MVWEATCLDKELSRNNNAFCVSVDFSSSSFSFFPVGLVKPVVPLPHSVL